MDKKLYVLGMGLALTGAFSSAQGSKKNVNRKPNVVFILADDLGWSDLGCYGSSFYETPNIDKFATEGIRFTNAYAACHVSSPTRASIITGQYPAHIHLTDWLPGRKNFPFQKLDNVVINQHIPYGISTLPKTLKANGYHTAIYGKWHLGEDSASTVLQGFDVHIPDWNKGWPNNTYFSPYNMKGLEGGPDGEYLTDRLTTEALKFIEENKNQPFFLYLAQFAVHDPIMGRPDLVKKYQEKLSKLKQDDRQPYILEANPDTIVPFTRTQLTSMLNEKTYEGYGVLPNRIVKIKQKQDNVEFAAMVTSLDENVGRVLSKLKELGLDDNTIVIFFSDNGGMSGANFGNPTKIIPKNKLDKNYSTSNLPLRGGKGWMYEGGIREPLIVRWPNHTKKGTVSDLPVISVDFFPTIMDMLGLKPQPEHKNLDGISIVPILENKKDIQKSFENRALYWHFPHYSNHGMQSPGGAIRLGDYKLLEYYENNTVQLFNLKNDIAEQHDISKDNPEMVKKLQTMLHAWRKKVNAQMPVKK